MKLRELDLNLLLVLDALLKERNVTLASQRLGVGQPAVSTALGKLRALFNDDLFVKNARGVEPTPRALALQAPLARMIFAIQDEILSQPAFDPLTATRSFVLVFGELGQIVFVPKLLSCLREAAPRTSLRVLGGSVEQRERLLESGEADLAIGLFPEFTGTGMFQQKLYAAYPLVCLARADHPALQAEGLTLDLFSSLDHAVVGTDTGYPQLCEPVLKRLGIERRVAVELSSLSATPYVLAESDLITIVPEALARIYCRDGKLRVYPSPIDFPYCQVRQFWHRRLHHDPAVTWLRQLIAAHFQDLNPSADAALPIAPNGYRASRGDA